MTRARSATPDEILTAAAAVCRQVLQPDRAALVVTPNVHLLAKLPQGGDHFAALSLDSVSYPPVAQSAGEILEATAQLNLAVYARVALDQGFSGEVLMTDPRRGLWPLSRRLLAALAGSLLRDDSGRGRLIDNLVLIRSESVGWGESGRLTLAYLVHHLQATFDLAGGTT